LETVFTSFQGLGYITFSSGVPTCMLMRWRGTDLASGKDLLGITLLGGRNLGVL